MLDVFHDHDAIRYQGYSPNNVQNKVTLVRKTSPKLDIMNVHECKCSKSMPIDIIGLVECHDEKEDNCYFDENDWDLNHICDLEEYGLGIDE